MDNIIYKEVQKFRQPILLISVGISVLILIGYFVYGYYEMVIENYNISNDNMNAQSWLYSIYTAMLVSVPVLLLIWFCKLETIVDNSGVHYRLFPFNIKYRSISTNQVDNAYIRKYMPMREYGGWGIRYSSNGMAYNVSGNMGIQFVLSNGKKILIGTQKPQEFYTALSKVFIQIQQENHEN